MTDRKEEKRVFRFLRLLAKAPARLLETGHPAVKLLEFPGERSVRCRSADIEAMARMDSVAISNRGDDRWIWLTASGRSAARRAGAVDLADQHRVLRQAHLEIEGHSESVVINIAESPLAALARLQHAKGQSWLDRAELAAGERLRVDFEQAMLQPRVTASWDMSRVARSGSSSGGAANDLTDRALAARQRVNAAIEAVGPDLGGALVDICCFLKGLEQVERERAWPRRSAKLMLKTALGMLDRHYHPQATHRRRSGRILHWGGEGYRPNIVS